MIWMPWSNAFRDGIESAGSLIFAIIQAIDKVKEGALDDESHALAANRIVRRRLDKRAITYQEYKHWRKLNPLIFTTLVDENNQLIGFFDIFPLKFDAGEDIIAGRLTERSLTADHIVPYADSDSATHLHIATIFRNPSQRVFTPTVAKEILLLKMREFLERHYAPLETRTFTAFAQSRAGETLLKKSGFSIALFANETAMRSPLYVLRPSEAKLAFSRFDRADEWFSPKDPSPRIDAVELKLRSLIVSMLDDDPSHLPPAAARKADNRVRTEVKSVASDLADYTGLSSKLVFSDLSDLKATITNGSVWPKFEARFAYLADQEILERMFDQLTYFRHAIKHVRPIDPVVRHNGVASLIWFERLLRKQALPRTHLSRHLNPTG